MNFALITADSREMRSGVIQTLRKKRLSVQVRTLDVGDYVIGEYAIERKTTHDFLSSLYGGRLFEQAQRISSSYETYLLIVEGDIYEALSNLKNPRVFWGALLSLALKFDFKILFTLDQDQTADLLQVLATKSRAETSNVNPVILKKPKIATTMDWQLFIVESLPAIGPKLGERLLRTFGQVRKIFQASRTELAVKGGLGTARATRISEVLDAEFSADETKQMKLTEDSKT